MIQGRWQDAGPTVHAHRYWLHVSLAAGNRRGTVITIKESQ
jgi:hypothetical protein